MGEIFDSDNLYKAETRMAGPVGFVIGLLILDYTYLAVRWIGTRYPSASQRPSRIIGRIPSSKGWFFFVVSLTIDIVLLFTFLSCLGVRFYPSKFYHQFVYDIREYPNTPAPFVIAYIAGISFPSIKHLLLLPLDQAIVALPGLGVIAYLTLGIAQHFMPHLWDSIKFRNRFSGSIHFVSGGFNFHTVFYVFWSTSVLYALSISIISLFSQSSATRKDWGLWTRQTYVQTFIHMVFIVLAIYVIPAWGIMDNMIVRCLLVGIIAVGGSWAVAFMPMGVKWACNRIRSALIG